MALQPQRVYTYKLDSAQQSDFSESARTKALYLDVLAKRGILTSAEVAGSIALANSWHSFLSSAAIVNHFPKSVLLTHKHLCAKTLRGSPWYPSPSFILPDEIDTLRIAVSAGTAPSLLILKPGRGGGGRGVRVVRAEDTEHCLVEIKSPSVASRYIANPLLVNGVKFDLRLYVMVQLGWSVGAVFSEGLVRFASTPYTLEPASLSNNFIHLTNNALNRRASRPQNWTLARFFSWLREQQCGLGQAKLEGSTIHIDRKELLWGRIKLLVADVLSRARESMQAALVAVNPVNGNEVKCFELFGFDLVVDEELQPFLCEVNSMPTLNVGQEDVDIAVDRQMVTALFQEVLNSGTRTQHETEDFLEASRFEFVQIS